MAENLEELSYDFHDETGTLVRKEVAKEILSRGAWSTVMFLYRELDRKSGEFRGSKAAIVRFKKVGGTYRRQSSFNVSSARQATQIVGVLDRWFGDDAGAETEETPDEATSSS